MPDSLTELAQQLDQFARERDWQQFHSPKTLASALVAGDRGKHQQRRPFDLFRKWHDQVEAWMHFQAGVEKQPGASDS